MRRPIAIALTSALAACGSNPVIPTCERNRTADIQIANTSSRSSHDVLLDGIHIVTLAPGGSTIRTVAAGPHLVEFRFSNTQRTACNPSVPNLAQCGGETIGCRADL